MLSNTRVTNDIILIMYKATEIILLLLYQNQLSNINMLKVNLNEKWKYFNSIFASNCLESQKHFAA